MSDRDPTSEDNEFAGPPDSDDLVHSPGIERHGDRLDQLLADPDSDHSDHNLPPRSAKPNLHSGDLDQLLADPADTDPNREGNLPPRDVKRDQHSGGLDQLLADPPDTDDALPPRDVKRDQHSGGLDQLLERLPETDHHRGRFAGYEAGTGVRKFIIIALALASIGAVIAGYMYITYLHDNRTPVHAVPLPEGTDISTRPRTMTWSSGKARLGLTREPPGLLEIELPDRVLRLAEGCDSAQVRLNVENGTTVEVIVLFGEVDEILRTPAAP